MRRVRRSAWTDVTQLGPGDADETGPGHDVDIGSESKDEASKTGGWIPNAGILHLSRPPSPMPEIPRAYDHGAVLLAMWDGAYSVLSTVRYYRNPQSPWTGSIAWTDAMTV